MSLRIAACTAVPTRPGRTLLAVCLLVAAGLAAAQVPPSSSAQIESHRAGIDAGDLDAAQRSLAIEQLDAAASADAAAGALLEQMQTLRSDAAQAPARTLELTQSLATDRAQAHAQWLQRLPGQVSTDMLERLLEQERSAIAGLRADLDRAGAELAQALSSTAPPETSDSELRSRAERLATPLVPAEGEPAGLTQARQLRRDAELRQARAELELRQVAQDGLMERQRYLELTLRELRHRLAIREPRLLALQERIAEVGRQELEALVAELEAVAQPAAGTSHAVATAAGRNRELAQGLLQDNDRLAAERAELEAEERARDRSVAVLRDSRVRLELGGSSEEVGRWLWRERRSLEPRARIAQHLAQLRNTLGRQRLRLVNLSEELRELSELPQAVRDLRADAVDGADDEAAAASRGEHAALTLLLEQRRSLLERQEPLLRRRIAALEQTEVAVGGHLEASVELQQILDRYLLWIPSHEPAGKAWLGRVNSGLGDLVKPSRLVTSGRLLAEAAKARPWLHLGAAIALVLLVVAAQRARRRIPALAQSVRRVRTDRFMYTLQALALTVVAALPWAAAALMLGLLLQQVGLGGKYSDSLGRALVAVVLPMLTVGFIRAASIEQGLGHAHFRWTRQRRETLQRLLVPLAAVLIPTYFIVSLAFLRNQDLATDVQARLALLLLCLAGAWACAWMLAPGRLWTARGVILEPSPMRRALRVLLPAFLLGCAGLALAGYVYSSAIVIRALLASVGVTMAVATVHGLLARWFLLGERQLALRRLDQRRAEQARDGGAASSGSDAESGETAPDLADEITLEMVNAQSRRLLRALRLTLLVLGLVAVWAEVLPAFSRLDEIGLWQTSEAGPDGATVAVPVTLMAVLLGLAVLVLTVIAARNLPGLIEIGLMSRAGVDAASRYAITSVARYAIVIAGVLIGVGLLGLRWGQLQWMAAALTVGLGFGLQEIFANFVSGLILLFERPFRVGDVITVGELSGTVTRIRTRATTILDFDNMEIVVPNKTFITGQLINWTLTDTTTRITIKVGVAYHTDPERVHALLAQAAKENPRVLEDPAPRSWFLAFGGSSLDFELRVFVGAIGDRLAVQNELNGRIAELMSEQGIEIAFPQLDLHVRDLPVVPERAEGAEGGGRPGDRGAPVQPPSNA
jgi:potassium efflux system protein